MNKSSRATGTQRENKWRNHVERFASSGQTVAAYCRGTGISENSFYFWRKRLQAEATPAISARSTMPAAFIDLGTVKGDAVLPMPRADRAQEANASGIEVRIELGGGIVLTIARH